MGNQWSLGNERYLGHERPMGNQWPLGHERALGYKRPGLGERAMGHKRTLWRVKRTKRLERHDQRRTLSSDDSQPAPHPIFSNALSDETIREGLSNTLGPSRFSDDRHTRSVILSAAAPKCPFSSPPPKSVTR